MIARATVGAGPEPSENMSEADLWVHCIEMLRPSERQRNQELLIISAAGYRADRRVATTGPALILLGAMPAKLEHGALKHLCQTPSWTRGMPNSRAASRSFLSSVNARGRLTYLTALIATAPLVDVRKQCPVVEETAKSARIASSRTDRQPEKQSPQIILLWEPESHRTRLRYRRHRTPRNACQFIAVPIQRRVEASPADVRIC
jgi:hypothetical protein